MKNLLLLLVVLYAPAIMGQKGFSLKDDPQHKKVEVLYNGKLLTAYCYFDSTEKPILFPVRSLSGVTITRGYPIAPRPGERTDHPHHVGLWLTYESVNGLDFWNNSFAIPQERKHLYGSIRHQKILSSSSTANAAKLKTLSHWVTIDGKVLLEETTDFTFSINKNDFVIDRKCILKAVSEDVLFRDVKDGFLGIRVARSLELPSQQQDKFIDSKGIETNVPALNNDGVSGMYINKEGTRGDSVWSSRSEWVQMFGQVQNNKVSVLILDHPSNIGYPTYWHARGYGLFAANPLGRSVFTNGKESLNLKVEKGKDVRFNYRIVIHEGDPMNSSEVSELQRAFAK